MPKITFQPLNVTVEIKPDQSILDAALDHGIPMQHACGGFCACTTCHVVIVEGDSHLSPMEENEEERLDRAPGLTIHSRLGCQAKITGDVTARILNLEKETK